jgi:hypothetical protein
MRRLVFLLVFCSWVILINALFSHHWTQYVSAQSVKKPGGRAAKFNRLFWAPSEISLSLQHDKDNVTRTDASQSRALAVVTPKTIVEIKPPKTTIQNETHPTSTKLRPLQSRIVDSLEAKHKHSGERWSGGRR